MYVVKLGGHLLYSHGKPNFKPYVAALSQASKKHSFHVVVGGGEIARQYIEEGRSIGVNSAELDLLGIKLSWVNAWLLQAGMRAMGAPHVLPEPDIWDIRRRLSEGRQVVVGGLAIAQSTTAVAASLAELTGADLLIYATNVDGIYTSDPKTSPGARRLDRVGIDRLIEMFRGGGQAPGTYKLFDLVSLSILKRSRIPVRVIDGRTPKNILRAMDGEDIGTLVEP